MSGTRQPGDVSNVGPTSRTNDRPTAKAAGQRGSSDHTIRARVERVVLAAGAAGITDDEIAMALPRFHIGSISKRRGELMRDGIVRDSGKTRRTRRGRDAVVWVAASVPEDAKPLDPSKPTKQGEIPL